MHIFRTVRETFSPSRRYHRLLLEDFDRFRKEIRGKMNALDVEWSLVNELYQEIVRKKQEADRQRIHDASFDLQTLADELKSYTHILFFRRTILFLKKIYEKNPAAEDYLRLLEKVASGLNKDLSDDLTTYYLPELRRLLEFLKTADVSRDSQVLRKFRIAVFSAKKSRDAPHFLRHLDLDEVKKVICVPIDALRSDEERLQKLQGLLTQYRSTIDRAASFSTIAVGEEVKRDVMRELTLLLSRVAQEYLDAHGLTASREALECAVIPLEGAHNLLSVLFENRLAIHGTDVVFAEHHLRDGIPTGGQGGANFVIDATPGPFGIGCRQCRVVTTVNALLLEALRVGAAVKIGDHVLVYDRHLIITRRVGTVLAQVTTESDIDKIPGLRDPRGAILQIERDDTVRLKVPWVVVTQDKDSYEFIRANPRSFANAHVLYGEHECPVVKNWQGNDWLQHLLDDEAGKRYLLGLLR